MIGGADATARRMMSSLQDALVRVTFVDVEVRPKYTILFGGRLSWIASLLRLQSTASIAVLQIWELVVSFRVLCSLWSYFREFLVGNRGQDNAKESFDASNPSSNECSTHMSV